MFQMAIILYGSSFWETAATPICRRPQGIANVPGANPPMSLLNLSCKLLTTSCGMPVHMVWRPWDNFCYRLFWGRWCT